MISEEKKQALNEELDAAGISTQDLSFSYSRPSGKGGQKMQKTESKVQVTHTPTALSAISSKTRSKEDNTFFAKRLLLEKYKKEILGLKDDKAEKIRKQKMRRKRRTSS